MINDDNLFTWTSTLCILLESGRFISIDIENGDVELREINKTFGPNFENDKTFQKLNIGIKPGTMWSKISDWNIDDYEIVIGNDKFMYRLEHTITPNPKYISEMKSSLRELKINKIINDTES